MAACRSVTSASRAAGICFSHSPTRGCRSGDSCRVVAAHVRAVLCDVFNRAALSQCVHGQVAQQLPAGTPRLDYL